MTLPVAGNPLSFSAIRSETNSTGATDVSTLAYNSNEYRAQFDDLKNTPHAFSEWYGYDHTIIWEHEVTVGYSTYTISGTTYDLYGFDSTALDAYGVRSQDFGAISESSPRWAQVYLNVGWLLWDENEACLLFYMYRSVGATLWGNTGFTSIQISAGANGVGPLNRTAATYNASDGSTTDPRFEFWKWTHANVGGLNVSPFGTTVNATATVRWR